MFLRLLIGESEGRVRFEIRDGKVRELAVDGESLDNGDPCRNGLSIASPSLVSPSSSFLAGGVRGKNSLGASGVLVWPDHSVANFMSCPSDFDLAWTGFGT